MQGINSHLRSSHSNSDGPPYPINCLRNWIAPGRLWLWLSKITSQIASALSLPLCVFSLTLSLSVCAQPLSDQMFPSSFVHSPVRRNQFNFKKLNCNEFKFLVKYGIIESVEIPKLWEWFIRLETKTPALQLKAGTALFWKSEIWIYSNSKWQQKKKHLVYIFLTFYTRWVNVFISSRLGQISTEHSWCCLHK